MIVRCSHRRPKPRHSNRGRRGITTGTGAEPEPTAHYPGTPDKVAVLRERAERGEALFSDEDAGRD